MVSTGEHGRKRLKSFSGIEIFKIQLFVGLWSKFKRICVQGCIVINYNMFT